MRSGLWVWRSMGCNVSVGRGDWRAHLREQHEQRTEMGSNIK